MSTALAGIAGSYAPRSPSRPRHFMPQQGTKREAHHLPETVSIHSSLRYDDAKVAQFLSRAGFKFVGPTMCYAFMQAAGILEFWRAVAHRIFTIFLPTVV